MEPLNDVRFQCPDEYVSLDRHPEDCLEVKISSNLQELPKYVTGGAAGMDLCADIHGAVILHPGARCLIPTGVFLEIPEGFEGQIRPRSGLAVKHGITVLNSPGTVDSDYRGEVKVLLVNLGQEAYTIQPKTRIAQIVFARYQPVAFYRVEALEDSERGTRGFGSTGV